ncbi:MAG: ATP-binding protein [Bacteroidales bacterium]|nr:ATP-binding protein [Bacteroidales bacterium]
MLIRFVVENMFSFGEQKEFSLIPNKRLKTLEHHRYSINDFDILKMASIYGANGAGKSNLIKSIELLQGLVLDNVKLFQIKDAKFKLDKDAANKSQILALEFFQDDTSFYYALEVEGDIIATEELYISGLGEKDELIYERKTNSEGETTINFLKDFEKDKKGAMLKTILIEEFVKPDELVLRFIANRDNKLLKPAKIAFEWFKNTLVVITPNSRPGALPHKIDIDKDFKNYAQDLMCSFNLGISDLTADRVSAKDFFGEENLKQMKEIVKELDNYPNRIMGVRSRLGDEYVIVKEEGGTWVKSIKIGHVGSGGENVFFDLKEESDGTVRLLDFLPAFESLLKERCVYLIDEIERSIHPLLIKELVQKYSHDKNTKGQLIFTTHESNLLNQDFFRRDEIWFAEKNMSGSTDIYSLNDFKEHNTIDIERGYLSGRYGSIPFLGNLQELNWHKHDTDE